MENQIEQYQLNQISGMSQAELILMLYRGAIRFLHEAKGALAQQRYDQSWSKLDRARKIILHLYSTLNLDAGRIATDLAALYSYVIEQICVANAKRETDPIDVCINILSTVKEAWEQLAEQEKQGEASAVKCDTPAEVVAAGIDNGQPVRLSIEA